MHKYENVDLAGNDIVRVNLTGKCYDEIEQILKSIPNACGCNSNGFVKHSIDPTKFKKEPGCDVYILADKMMKPKAAEQVGKNDNYSFFHQDLERNLRESDISTFKSWKCLGKQGLWIYVPDEHLAVTNYEKNLQAALSKFPLQVLQDPMPNQYTLSNGTDVIIARHAGDLARANVDLSRFDHILECGGGYGVLANIILSSGFAGTYTIFDFERMEKIFRRYITSIASLTGLKTKPFEFVHDPDKIVYRPKTLLISTWGISEMPSELASKIIANSRPDGFYIIAQNMYDQRQNIPFFTQLTGVTPTVYDSNSSRF
ncbi:MAG: hypothetical protein ABJA64_02740, partial [Candidatus Saccharibacteria bacterium]